MGSRRRRSQSQATLPIAAALRLLRQSESLSKVEIARRGGPDHRSISHWETGRKKPSLDKLYCYLNALNLTFHDLQSALDQINSQPAKLSDRLSEIENRLTVLEKGLMTRRRKKHAQHPAGS